MVVALGFVVGCGGGAPAPAPAPAPSGVDTFETETVANDGEEDF